MITVVIEDNGRGDISVEEAAQFKDALDISYTVLADVDRDWVDAWGGTRHSYSVIDSNGIIVFHQIGNSRSLVDDLADAALAAD